MEKEIWKGLIGIAQEAHIEDRILQILSTLPCSGIDADTKTWFNKESSNQDVTKEDFFTFLQKRAMTNTHELSKPSLLPAPVSSIAPSVLTVVQSSVDIFQKTAHDVPKPTLLPTPLPATTPSAIPAIQTSLDMLQKTAAWQQLGVKPILLSQPIFTPQTPPPTPTLPGPLLVSSTSPSPHSLTSPACTPLPVVIQMDNPESQESLVEKTIVSQDDESKVCQQDVNNPLKIHSFEHTNDYNLKVASTSPPSIPMVSIGSLAHSASSQIEPMELDSSPMAQSLEPTVTAQDLEDKTTTATKSCVSEPMALDSSFLEEGDAIQSRTSNKAEDMLGSLTDDDGEHYDGAINLAKVLNAATDMNASQDELESHRGGSEIASPKPSRPPKKKTQEEERKPHTSRPQKKKTQGKEDHKPYNSGATASPSKNGKKNSPNNWKNGQQVDHVHTVEKRSKNEVIDLTLEEVGCRVIFRTVF